MKLKLVVIAALATASLSRSALAKPKPSAPCRVYFLAVEQDEITVGLSMEGLNKPQEHWYRKHGDRDKWAGVCFAKTANVPVGATLYLISWGEHLVSEPYSYETSEPVTQDVDGTVTDDNGNTSQVNGTMAGSVPVEHTGTRSGYVADGRLYLLNSAKGKFEPVAPLHSGQGFSWGNLHFSSASTSLLKNGIKQIEEQEKQRLHD
jgi:hypothetical protein